jgi:hypothetical protein
MRVALVAAGMVVLLGGCETFEETYTIEQDVIIDEQGVRVVSDLEEDFWGSSWFQFRAYNSNSFPICVRVSLEDGSYTSGHSLGGAHRIEAGGAADVGYITNPSEFYINTGVFSPSASGECY